VAPHLRALPPRTIGEQLAERLAEFQDQSRPEGRNRSLLASLDFSLRHLSPAAREALPWLGWFEGGMFEAFFLAFSGIAPARWSGIRAELTATALLRVEDLPLFNTPYLKLHPTLAESAAPATGDGERTGSFIDGYLQVRGMVACALRGAQPAAGMALMRLEERNLRRALGLAFAGGRHRDGAMLADTLRGYLERSGRLRERDRLTGWVRHRMPDDRLDEATCAAIRRHAWSLFTQGQAQEALDAVLDLERRLAGGGLAPRDADFQRAMTRTYRGRILYNAGRPDLALGPLDQAIDGWRALGDDQRGNLSAALGDLANALRACEKTSRPVQSAGVG
jgi:tetratricopeptide (TPR) repeat protein